MRSTPSRKAVLRRRAGRPLGKRGRSIDRRFDCAAAWGERRLASDDTSITLQPPRTSAYPRPAAMRKLNAALPGSRYVELAGAGHISNMDQPQAFTRAIQDFLAAA